MAFQYPPSPHSFPSTLPSSPLVTCPPLFPIHSESHPPPDIDMNYQPSTPTKQTSTLYRETLRHDSLSPKTSLSSSVSPLSTFASVRKRQLHPTMTTQSDVAGPNRPVPSHSPAWKVSPDQPDSPSKGTFEPPMMYHSHSHDHMARYHYTGMQQKPLPGLNLASRRRTSRFDPMGKEEEMDEEGYGELGQRHPLRRVAEEDGKEEASVSLPGIKALFGVANDNPQTPSSASMYASSSLPSLVPNSPSSSPSTARTSRYSSLTSQHSASSETFPTPGIGGWWAPDFERSSQSSSSSPRHPGAYRANSFPSIQPFMAEHADKRRRSDGPPALRDAEESVRLRWQAQSRNASYPTTGPAPSPNPHTNGLRSLLHPPPASSSMSRASMSGSSGFNSPLTPFHEHANTPEEYPFERRIAPVPSRSASLVGGQLSQSFAELSAAERADRRSPLAQTDMAPPSVPDRRPSAFHPGGASSPRPNLPPSTLSRPSSTGPNSRPPSIGPDSMRRQSLTRPSSPDTSASTPIRQFSLTEAIMAKSGDDVTMGPRRFSANGQNGQLGPPTPSESTQAHQMPTITGWPPRKISTDSTASVQGISLNSDNEGQQSSKRGLKRGPEPAGQGSQGDAADPGMRGMEVLAEISRRVQEAEREQDDGENSPPRAMQGGPGQIQGSVVMGQGGAGPKYACAFCPKTFSRPSSLRIHTYSHTGERPFVCKEPSCRRRFSVQSNLKRHAKVHQMGGQPGGPSLHQLGPNGGGVGRPIERSHRQSIPPSGYYHPQPPPHHLPHPPHGQLQGYHPYPGKHDTTANHQGGPTPDRRGSQQEEGWEDEEDELEEDELEDELEEEEKS